MKKLLVLLALAFVVCVPELCYSVEGYAIPKEDQWLLDTYEGLNKVARDLGQTGMDLKGIASISSRPDSMWIIVSFRDIDQCCTLCILMADMLVMYAEYTDQRAITYWSNRLIHLIGAVKESISRANDGLGLCYGVLETPAALHQIDKARTIIRSSLPLFDEAIQILEAKQEKK